MSKILRNHQISAAVIDIIDQAKEYCVLVTPYYQSWPLLDRALDKIATRGVALTLVMRDEQENNEKALRLNDRYECDVALIRRLHTKLYMNERQALVGSMNLYDASKENNYEVGYLIDQRYLVKQFWDEVVLNDLFALPPAVFLPSSGGSGTPLMDALRLGERQTPERDQPPSDRSQSGGTNGNGYCIRCRTSIPINEYLVLCDQCFETWRKFGDPDFREQFCHLCGVSADVSKARPVCRSCWTGR